MNPESTVSRTWVVLTMGDRPDAVDRALRSIAVADPGAGVLLVVNGAVDEVPSVDQGVRVLVTGENLGVPGGRDRAVEHCSSDVIVFLDDDAVVATDNAGDLLSGFFAEARTAAVSFRIVDEYGQTARRHVPRFGRGAVDQSGQVAVFLGGACAIRRSAYIAAGGYWPLLFYAHEELDLSWRLIDCGYRIDYEPSIEVLHPRTPISRHTQGWTLTGRNRVLVARRNLPAPILVVHTMLWLLLGALRAPDRSCRSSYLRGWNEGWRLRDVPRRAIRWSTVFELCRLRRPPLL